MMPVAVGSIFFSGKERVDGQEERTRAVWSRGREQCL
jgi:hypothetical protein